jgi:four helix bundle protein
MSELPYRRWVLWQRADAIANEVVAFVERPELPLRPYFRDQLSRSAYSVPANIAEGLGRATPLDTASFLDRARGSLFETDYWVRTLGARSLVDPGVQSRWAQEFVELNAMLVAIKKRLYARADATRPGSRRNQPPAR